MQARGGTMKAGERQQAEWKKLGVMFTSLVMLAGLTAVESMSQPMPSQVSTFPVGFEANNRPDSPIKYSARTACYTLFISNEEADVVLHGEKAPSNELRRGGLIVVKAYASLVRMRFLGSNLPTAIMPLDEKDRPHPPYTAVAYRGIYPGTDLLLRPQQRRIAFQVNLSAGADPQTIVLELAGTTGIKLDNAGNAIVKVGHASLVLQRPVIRIRASASQQPAPGAYRIERGNRLRFMVPDGTPANRQTIGD